MLKTIDLTVSNSMKEQRSEFIAYLYPIDNVSMVKNIFSKHSEQYRDATHNCYAYVIGKKQEWQYYSDQGEPSGTAGKPILNMLLKYELTNVLAIVTRYYGGIKLGVRGLIDAYSGAVEQVILNASLTEYHYMERLFLTMDYSILDTLKHFVKTVGGELTNIEYSNDIKAEIAIPEEHYAKTSIYLEDLIQKNLLTIIS